MKSNILSKTILVLLVLSSVLILQVNGSCERTFTKCIINHPNVYQNAITACGHNYKECVSDEENKEKLKNENENKVTSCKGRCTKQNNKCYEDRSLPICSMDSVDMCRNRCNGDPSYNWRGSNNTN